MNKYLIFIICILMLLISCSTPSENEETKSNESASSETQFNNTEQDKLAATYGSPDLRPTQIQGPSRLQLGTTGFFDSGVANYGSPGTGTFNVKWYIENNNGYWQQIGYGGHNGVPAYTAVYNGNSQIYYTPSYRGYWTIKFYVDCDNSISESNENNNMWTYTFEVY